VMASNANKGKEIVAADKGFKGIKKSTKGSSSSAKGAPTRRFGERVVEPYGLSCFKIKKRSSNMLLRIELMKAASYLSSPPFGT
ncbi:hypothetical protein HAX54_052899, partial [Datura stramonium]|nr:hypothetical protein [Datura stramonium]